MRSTPIAQCDACEKQLYLPGEFLILVPPGISGDVDIGGFDAYCERCYCAMGVSGGRQRWDRAMAPFTEQWRRTGSGTLGVPWLCEDGWTWDPGSNPMFPGGVSLTYVDRKRVDLFVFNRNGRCVLCTLPPDSIEPRRKYEK